MYKKLLLICGLILFPSIVLADSITIDCPESIEPNKEFACAINGNSTAGISGIDMKLSVSSSLELLSVVIDSEWQGDGEKGDIKIFAADAMKGDFKIGEAKLKLKESSGTLLLSSIIVYDDNVKPKQMPAVSKQVSVKEVATTASKPKTEKPITTKKGNKTEEASVTTKTTEKEKESPIEPITSSKYLIDIKIDNYNLDFYKEVFEYDLKIGNEKKLKITPTLEDSSAEYEIIGNNNLKDGSVVTIRVTSATKETQDYAIKIQTETKKKNYKWVFIPIIGGVIIINAFRIVRGMVKKK